MLKYKKTMAVLAILSLVLADGLVNGLVQMANAASLTATSDRLSDSNVSAVATHTVTTTINTSLIVGDYFNVVLPGGTSGFGPISSSNIGCPASTTASLIGTSTARCTVINPITAPATSTITVGSVSNPSSAGSQTIAVTTNHSGGAVIESASAMVAIISSVNVSASVPATLTFEIRPVNSGTAVNGTNMTATSATTSVAFGNLVAGTSSVEGQELHVTTNAADGYSVTVQQSQNLTSAGGATIASFRDGTTSAPQVWQTPASILDAHWTYGHFGFTTDDASLSGGNLFGGSKWQGFSGATPVEVMYHNGPADGTTQDKGTAKVAYRVQISSLQDAGDYSTTLTYVATPVY